MEKGDVLRRHQDDPDGGLACYEEAHAADPKLLAPILALEKLYRERGQLDALRSAIEAHLSVTENAERRAALLLSLSQLEGQLPDCSEDRRWELLEQARVLTAQPGRILAEMERVARRDGRLERRLEVIEHRKQALLTELESVGEPGRESLEPTLASPAIAPAPQERPSGSAPDEVAGGPEGLLAREAPSAPPVEAPSAPPVEAPSAPPVEAPSAPPVEAPSAPLAEASAASQVKPLEQSDGAGLSALGSHGATREELLLAAFAQARLQARLLEKNGEPERAWELLLPWRERIGNHAVLKGDLLGLAARLGRWNELASLLLEQEREASQAELGGLKLERAMALHRAGQSDQALALVRGSTEAGSLHPVVLALQELTALGAGDIEAQKDLLARVLERLDSLSLGDTAEDLDAWRAELWTERALLGLEAGETLSSVKDACRAARAAVPGYPPATDLLETLLIQEGAWADLVALYKLELVGAPDDRAVQLLESLADLQTAWHPSPDGRLDALLQLTLKLPQSLSHRLRLLDALVELGRPEDVLEQVEPILALCPSSPELCAEIILLGARTAGERLKDSERARALLGRGLDLCPGHPELVAQMEALLRDSGRNEELAAFYRAEVAKTLEDEKARRLLLQLAWILERDLLRPKEAAEVYEQLWQRNPGDTGVLALLGRALAASRDFARLAEILELLADGAVDPVDKASLNVLQAELLADRVKDGPRAEDAYLRARAIHPEASEPLFALAELAGRRRDWAKVAEAYDELLRSEQSDEVRRMALSELAWLAEGPSSDVSGASEHSMALAALDPPIPTAYFAAARLALSRREWGGVASALDWLTGMAEKAGETSLMVSLGCRAAAFGLVAGMQPGPRLLRAAQAVSGGEMARVLATDLVTSGSPDSVDLLGRRLQESTPEEERQGFDLLLAALLEREGRLREAAGLLKQGLVGSLADLPRLLLLRHLAHRAGQGALIAELSERIAAYLSDDERAAALLREGASAASSPGDSARLLRQALSRSPRDGDALAALVKSLVDLGRAEEAAQCIGYRLSQGISDEEAIGLRMERASLRVSALKDPQGAAVDLYQVLQLNPDHKEALTLLARLQAEDGAYGEAAALLVQRLDLATSEDPESLKPVRFLLAEVLERDGRPMEEVIEPLETLLIEHPGDPEILERKHAALLRGRDFPAAVAVLDERYRGLADRKERAEGEVRKALVFRDLAANDEEARRAFEAARDMDPLCREAILSLCTLYRKFDDQGSLKMVLSSAMDAYRESFRRASSIDSEPVRFLARLFEEAGNTDGERLALGVLEAMGALSAEEKPKLSRFRGAILERQPGRLTAEIWSKYLFHPHALGALTDLWEIIGPATYQLWPEDLAVLGVGRSERVSSKNASGVAKEIFDLSGSFGIGLEEIYVGGNQPSQIRVVANSAGAALVVGSRVGPKLSLEERHRMGAILAGVRLSTLALPRIPAAELELLVASAIREGQPEYRLDLPAERMEDIGKRFRKVLSRKDRKALPLTAVSAAGAGVDIDRWRLGLGRTLARVGLLCSGEVKASVEAERTQPDESRLSKDPDATRELLLFALSDAHLELRRALGVAP
jgi:thioredoxin-like negative regulator of GroEL